MSRKLICILLMLSLSLLIGIPGVFAQMALWNDIPIGETVYVEIMTAPDALYMAPSTDAQQTVNELEFSASFIVKSHWKYLNPGAVIRGRIIDPEWFEILPEENPGGVNYPFPTNSGSVYIKTAHLNPLSSIDFAPISLSTDPELKKKIVVVDDGVHPEILLLENDQIILKSPAVLGETPHGDFRIFYTRASDNMPGIAGVPFTSYFADRYAIHGAPWWNWTVMPLGGYGSHGCINLPDESWYTVDYHGKQLSVSQWVYRWISTNLDYDETDPTTEYAWNQMAHEPGTPLTVFVVSSINELQNYEGEWQSVIDSYNAGSQSWLLPHVTENGDLSFEAPPKGISIAQIKGLETDVDTYVILACDTPSEKEKPAYPGSSRLVKEVCFHLRVERNMSICTPERVDMDFMGKKVLCDGTSFQTSTLDIRGELIKHENIHIIQFSGYFKELVSLGVAADDLTPSAISYDQLSSIGVTELMAMKANSGSILEGDYVYVLAQKSSSGEIVPVNFAATVEEAWQFLHEQCGDASGIDPVVDALLETGLMGNKESYLELTARCSMPPHQLIPDRVRPVRTN